MKAVIECSLYEVYLWYKVHIFTISINNVRGLTDTFIAFFLHFNSFAVFSSKITMDSTVVRHCYCLTKFVVRHNYTKDTFMLLYIYMYISVKLYTLIIVQAFKV